MKTLYEELGYMGNIAIADYVSKGHLNTAKEESESENLLIEVNKESFYQKIIHSFY